MPRLKRWGGEKCFFSPYFLFRMKTVIFLDDKYTVHAMDIIFVFTQVSILQGTTCSTIQWPRCNFPKMNSWSLTRNNSQYTFIFNSKYALLQNRSKFLRIIWAPAGYCQPFGRGRSICHSFYTSRESVWPGGKETSLSLFSTPLSSVIFFSSLFGKRKQMKNKYLILKG